MPLTSVGQCLHIFNGVHAVSHRPHEGVRVVGVNVIVHGDTNFSAVAFKEGGTIKRPPNFSFRGVVLHGDDGHAQQTR